MGPNQNMHYLNYFINMFTLDNSASSGFPKLVNLDALTDPLTIGEFGYGLEVKQQREKHHLKEPVVTKVRQ